MAKRSYAHGTPEQMLAAFESKLQELGGDVSACSSVQASESIDREALMNEVDALAEQFVNENELDGVTALVSLSGNREVSVELSGGEEYLPELENYIANNLQSAGTTVRIHGDLVKVTFRNDDEYREYEENKPVNSAAYVDTDGAFGEPGATITDVEMRDYWEREHLNDPTLSQYGEGGFDEWYRDTKQWLTPVKSESYVHVETNPEAASRFIHTLIGDVDAALEANSELDAWTWEEQENDVVLTTVAGESVNEYSIPKADLTMDWDRISEDVDYILNEVQSVEDEEVFDGARHSDAVESSQIVEGSEYRHWDETAEQYLHEMQAVNIDISDKPAVLNELMNNFGFTQEDAEGLFVRINECAADLSSEVEGQYEKVRSKMVPDSDGFMTDYTMYYDTVNDRYVFVFGDNEVYKPEDEDFDWECETEEQANDWFDSYTGFAEDGPEDIYSSVPTDDSNNNEAESTYNWKIKYNNGAVQRCQQPNRTLTVQGTWKDVLEQLQDLYVDLPYEYYDEDEDIYTCSLDEFVEDYADNADFSGSTVILTITRNNEVVFDLDDWDEDYDDEY